MIKRSLESWNLNTTVRKCSTVKLQRRERMQCEENLLNPHLAQRMFIIIEAPWGILIKIQVLNKLALSIIMKLQRAINSKSRIQSVMGPTLHHLPIRGTLHSQLTLEILIGRIKTWLLKKVGSFNFKCYSQRRNSNRCRRRNRLRKILRIWESKISTAIRASSKTT